MESRVLDIPIKMDNYEDLFNEFDYRSLERREVKEEIDNFIDMSILKSKEDMKHTSLELIIHLPREVKDEKMEALTKGGIINHYKANFEYEKKIKALGSKRIIYYGVSALILLVSWYYIVTYSSESFLTSLLNAGGTVLLWEIMGLVLIERKNYKDRGRLNKKLSKMEIKFQYI